jgi:hypothetical protein
MVNLPQGLTLSQLSTKWASILNVLLNNSTLNRSVLPNISLAIGSNTIPHKLGRPLQGWNTCRIHGVATSLYDLQDTNQMPELTLVLHSTAATVVDLEVF